jgi:hypothetical protein
MASKRSKPAPRARVTGLEIDQLASTIYFENITPTLQAQYVAQRFRLPLARASLIAEFAFNCGRHARG